MDEWANSPEKEPKYRAPSLASLNRTHRKPKGSRGASIVTNRPEIAQLPEGERSWLRRVRDVYLGVANELGGTDFVSMQRQLLIRRVAVLTAELERREVAFARSGMINDQQLLVYQTVVNSLRRTLEALGLERVPREVDGVRRLDDILAELDKSEKLAAAINGGANDREA